MPGTGGVPLDFTSTTLLVVMSPAGPEKLICMLLAMPGPNINMDVLVPRATESPVEKAVLPPTPSPQPAMRDKQNGTTRAFQIFESTGSAPNRCAKYDALDLSLVVRFFLI